MTKFESNSLTHLNKDKTGLCECDNFVAPDNNTLDTIGFILLADKTFCHRKK